MDFLKDNRLHIITAARKGLFQCFNVSYQVPEGVRSFQMPHEVFASPVITTGIIPPLMFLGSKYGNLIAIDAHKGKRDVAENGWKLDRQYYTDFIHWLSL